MSGTLAVIVAAGRSVRFGGTLPKQFLDLGGQPLVSRAVGTLAGCPGIDGVIVVLPEEEIGGARAAMLLALPGVRGVVAGGSSRLRSSLAGVEAAAGAEVVLVHDAARPFVAEATVAAVLAAARAHGAAVPVLPVRDTVKSDDGAGFVGTTLDRATLRLAQTPQGARYDLLLRALRRAVSDGVDVTDEAQAIERIGEPVALVAGDPGNIKITTPDDLREVDRRARSGGGARLRVGHGYDVHRTGGQGPLMLGGVRFEGEGGLSGHSDADVVLHAAMDAALGAAGLPDIGHFFPPDDARFRNADSATLAREVAAQIAAAGFAVVNLDLTVLAERPKIAPRLPAMRSAVAGCFGIDPSRVGVKATTHEGLGALGRGEGIACHAVVLLADAAGRP
jgi:2-C-methyl-D-erythritol 4-phosphate cytidylyltransferase / 2-C-methyl-D-erythritol 2,4-cyclodiphosphate synthase